MTFCKIDLYFDPAIERAGANPQPVGIRFPWVGSEQKFHSIGEPVVVGVLFTNPGERVVGASARIALGKPAGGPGAQMSAAYAVAAVGETITIDLSAAGLAGADHDVDGAALAAAVQTGIRAHSPLPVFQAVTVLGVSGFNFGRTDVMRQPPMRVLQALQLGLRSPRQ